jgi:hypothetical protein
MLKTATLPLPQPQTRLSQAPESSEPRHPRHYSVADFQRATVLQNVTLVSIPPIRERSSTRRSLSCTCLKILVSILCVSPLITTYARLCVVHSPPTSIASSGRTVAPPAEFYGTRLRSHQVREQRLHGLRLSKSASAHNCTMVVGGLPSLYNGRNSSKMASSQARLGFNARKARATGTFQVGPYKSPTRRAQSTSYSPT